jgi:hypothetical protein
MEPSVCGSGGTLAEMTAPASAGASGSQSQDTSPGTTPFSVLAARRRAGWKLYVSPSSGKRRPRREDLRALRRESQDPLCS